MNLFRFAIAGTAALALSSVANAHGGLYRGPGDTVVQNGTRHRWRNPFDEPCVMALFMVGAHRS